MNTLILGKYTLFKRKAEDRYYAEQHYGKGKRAPSLSAFIEDRHFFIRGECRWLLRREAGGHEITENTLRVYRLALKKINGLTRGVFSLEELAKLFPLDRGDLFRIWGE